MSQSSSVSPKPMCCEKCGHVLIERVYLDEKGNTAIDAHGQHEDVQYDAQKDKHYVDCPECGNEQTVHLRPPT